MRWFIGFDPDLHNAPMAAWDDQCKAWYFAIAKVRRELTGEQAVCAMCSEVRLIDIVDFRQGGACVSIESQEVALRGSRRSVRPADLIKIATVSGAFAAHAFHSLKTPHMRIPTPTEWTGGVPKAVGQARLMTQERVAYTKAGGQAPYCVPTQIPDNWHLGNVAKSDWKHIIDAMRLARWGQEQYHKDKIRAKHGVAEKGKL